MQNFIIRNIMVAVLLIALCYLVGSAAAEDYKMSAVMIAALIGVVFMLIMGTKSWMLLFYLPALMVLLPLPGGVRAMPLSFYAGVLVFGYYFLLWTLGYVKFCWRPLVVIDFLVLIIFVIAVASYIRRPVAVDILQLDYDMVGGREYIVMVLAVIYYLALSCIPVDSQKLPRVMNCSVVMIIIGFAIYSLMYHDVAMEIAQKGVERLRFDGFCAFGMVGVKAIFAYFSLGAIMMSPMLLVGIAVATGAVLLGGSRAAFVEMMITVLTISFIKRQLTSLVCAGIVAYSLLFVLGNVGALKVLPHGMQRVLAEVPGLNVSRVSKKEGQATWDWRLELWERAWDHRTGYIQDYVWGDGFGMSKSIHNRAARAVMRGENRESSVDEFARAGLWHNGIISTVHRIGYVGLGALSSLLIIGSIFIVKICCMLRGTPLFRPILFYTSGYVAFIPEYCWGAHGPDYVFMGIGSLAVIKLAYHEARKMGIELIWFRRQRYEPLMIQEYGERISAECHKVR